MAQYNAIDPRYLNKNMNIIDRYRYGVDNQLFDPTVNSVLPSQLDQVTTPAKSGALSRLFGGLSKYKGSLGKLNNISIRDIWNKGIGDPELLGWSKGKGISVLGGDIGSLYTGGKGLVDTFRYLDSANKMSKSKQESDDIKSEILASAASNPLYSQYLTQDEINTVNKIKRGNYNPEGTNPFDDMGAVGMGALRGGLTGLVAGGLPGAILGAVGSGANAGIQSRRKAQEQTNTQLESLLQSLNDASAQYKSMRRPNFTTLGIQNRFQDLYR